MKQKIKAVTDRIDYLTKRIRSSKANLKRANNRIDHFLVVAKRNATEWKKAEKNKDQVGMQKAKAKTQRAHKKLAFWEEVKDDIHLGMKKAIQRRAYQRKKLAQLKKLYSDKHDTPSTGAGFQTIDGHQVPKWMSPGILELRSRGLWSGSIISGYRTPEYSRQLCRNICGADHCPGRCAGVSSNHTCPPTFSGIYHEGAVDVSDYYRFGAGCRIIGLELHNALPMDRVHYSYTGS